MSLKSKPYTGMVFTNDKQGKEARPDWTGSCDINGVKHYMSGWNRVGKDGKQQISWAFKPAPQTERDGEEIPFQ